MARAKKTQKPQETDVVVVDTTVAEPLLIEGDSKVGLLLKAARVKKKAELEKIADKLYIRPSFLKALEESDYKAFPGQVYALGFLKTYATYLKLDVSALMDMYRQETAFLKPKPLVMPIPEKQHVMPHPKYFIWAFLLIVIVGMTWYLISYPEVEKSEQFPVMAEEVVEASLPSVPVVPEEVNAMVSDTPTDVAVVAAPVSTTRVRLVAKEDTWLEIMDGDTFVFNKVLKKGETFNVPAVSDNMLLKTGNAGGVDVFVDDQAVKALGPNGAVRSRISLSPEKLKNR